MREKFCVSKKNGFPTKNLGNDIETPSHSRDLQAGIHEKGGDTEKISLFVKRSIIIS